MVGKRRLRNLPPWDAPPSRPAPARCATARSCPARASTSTTWCRAARAASPRNRVHRICHRKIHATFTEKELARDYARLAVACARTR